MRRDEDPVDITKYQLWWRQACLATRDLFSIARRGQGASFAATMLRFHWWTAKGRTHAPGPPSIEFVKVVAFGQTTTAWFRPELADLFTLREVFLQCEYDLTGLPVGRVDRILDVGSNIGLSALYFSLQFPDAHIACVEPAEENLRVLQTGQRVNQAKWHCLGVALTPSTQFVPLYPNGWRPSTTTSQTVALRRQAVEHRPEGSMAQPTRLVQGLSFSTLLAELGWDSVDLLKLDVEGAEHDLLNEGDPVWLHKVRTLVIDIHDKYVDRAFVVRRLGDFGLQPVGTRQARTQVFTRSQVRTSP